MCYYKGYILITNGNNYQLFFCNHKKFDAAMSKLSFRARALDANKSLPVFHEDDVPDLPDIASVNRVVPQMPTGMEKEEETEHHLQRAITAQQIYGEAQRLIIPTPDTLLYDSDYKKLKKLNVQIPKQFIHVQAFTLEDELPDYDCDEKDMEWIEKHNKSNPDNTIKPIDFEKMIDTIEKGCGSRMELFTITDAKALLRKNDDIVTHLYEYWKSKKKTNDGNALTPTVRTEKKDGNTFHDPYVAFRRRVEKMQTRKNRKNDEASYEKMLRLRRDLNRACVILEMVKLREQQKRDLLHTTIKILETRASNKDFNGELLHQCYDLIKNRPIQPPEQNISRLSLNNNNISKTNIERKQAELLDERYKRNEAALEESRKRQKLKLQNSGVLKTEDVSSNTTTSAPSTSVASRLEPDHSYDGPDGKFSFRRKKGVIYHAPRYDSVGNWPWTHPVEGGSADSRFCYCYTSVTKDRNCIRFARRRIGRGGRYLFDRAYTPYDQFISKSTLKDNSLPFQDRAPPWPHFKPNMDSSSSDDEESHSSCSEKNNSHFNRWFQKERLYKKRSHFKPRLQRTFSASTNIFNPYPKRTANNNNNSSVNNQSTSTSKNTTRISKIIDSSNFILSTKQRKNNFFTTQQVPVKKSTKNITTQHISPSRQTSTAPASAIYQLNFPLALRNQNKKNTDLKPKNNSLPNNINKKLLPTDLSLSKQNNVKSTVATLVTYINRSNSVTSSATTSVGSSQSIVSRQPLSIVQERSFATPKVLPNSSNQVQLNTLQVPTVNSVRTNKLSISKGLTITHTPVVSNGLNKTQPGIQVAR